MKKRNIDESEPSIPYLETEIPAERSRADIEKLLEEHGIIDHRWTSYHGANTLEFIWNVEVRGVKKEVRFLFAPPQIMGKRKVFDSETGKSPLTDVWLKATSYRLLWHYLKNKLAAVRWGMVTVEKEFLSNAIVELPDGSVSTVGEHIQKVYEQVRAPALENKPINATQSKIIDVGIEK